MIHYRLKRFLLSPTELHILCALAALGACVPALFPDICPEDAEQLIRLYAGMALMGAFIASAAAMGLAGAIHIFRLNNIKALVQLLKWALVWAAAFGLFLLLALVANVPPMADESDAHPIQTTDTLAIPHDTLTGPEALTLPVNTDDVQTDTVEPMPNLTKLEERHEEILNMYLQRSPRWQGMKSDDTFFSKPGHLVMVPPTTSGTPGLVHVCFRHLTEGAPLPSGYVVLKPGDPFPAEETQDTDFAIDLGRNYYLLLAWRGTAHAETMRRALNAAMRAIDERMQTLADAPTAQTIENMLEGRRSYAGDTPEIRLSEPPGQEGSYQAEIYVNPGEPGTLLIYCRDLENKHTLRLLHCPARYSQDKEELFRHNIPGDVPEWLTTERGKETEGVLHRDAPVFILGTSSEHRYFGVAVEVWFRPADGSSKRRMLLRRCYRMQMLDAAAGNAPVSDTASPPIPAADDEDDEDTPPVTTEKAAPTAAPLQPAPTEEAPAH